MGRLTLKEQRRRELQERREAGAWFPIPVVVIRSEAFCRLSSHAVKLLFDLLSQYSGQNNGDLSAAWTLMKPRGWKSKDTLNKALHELVDAGWIIKTRQGGKNFATLYAVSFFAIDECRGKLDVKATQSPPGGWDGGGALRGMPGEILAILMRRDRRNAATRGVPWKTANNPSAGSTELH